MQLPCLHRLCMATAGDNVSGKNESTGAGCRRVFISTSWAKAKTSSRALSDPTLPPHPCPRNETTPKDEHPRFLYYCLGPELGLDLAQSPAESQHRGPGSRRRPHPPQTRPRFPPLCRRRRLQAAPKPPHLARRCPRSPRKVSPTHRPGPCRNKHRKSVGPCRELPGRCQH